MKIRKENVVGFELSSQNPEIAAMVVREKMEFDEFYLAYLVDPTGVGFEFIQKK